MSVNSRFARFERSAMLLWGALFGIASLMLLWLQGRLPERVASHFDWSGRVDGWMGRESFFVLNSVLLILLNGLIAGLVLYARKNRQSLPEQFGRFGIGFHFPNRSYWLATAERAREAMSRVALCLVGAGVYFNVTMLSVFHLVFQENGGAPWVAVPIPLIIGGTLALALGLIVAIRVAFHVSSG